MIPSPTPKDLTVMIFLGIAWWLLLVALVLWSETSAPLFCWVHRIVTVPKTLSLIWHSPLCYCSLKPVHVPTLIRSLSHNLSQPLRP